MIDEFWVINENGICYYYKSSDPNLIQKVSEQSDLFSGMFSAIIKLHTQLSGTKLRKFEDGEGKFLFFSRKGLIFIVKAKLNMPDEKIKKRVSLIQERFIEKYKDSLDAFNGDVSEFKKYEKDLDTIFNDMSKVEIWGKELEALGL
jgi:hypothetical protein